MPGYANIGVAGYAAIAYLVEELHNPGNTATQDGDISEAIWYITDPNMASDALPYTIDPAAIVLAGQADAYAAAATT